MVATIHDEIDWTKSKSCNSILSSCLMPPIRAEPAGVRSEVSGFIKKNF